MLNILRKNKKVDPVSEYDLQFVYESADGSKWFEYKNPMNVPAKRAIAAEVATRFVNMNLTKGELKRLLTNMKDNANKGDIVSLFNILAEIEFRLDFIGEESTLLELAATYYILEGEKADVLSESWTEKKKQILKDDADAKDFFLQKVYLFTTRSSELSGADFLKYLKKNKENAERIRRYLSATMSADILKT